MQNAAAVSLLGALLVSIANCRFSENIAGEVGSFLAAHDTDIANIFCQAAPAIMSSAQLDIRQSLLERNNATEVSTC